MKQSFKKMTLKKIMMFALLLGLINNHTIAQNKINIEDFHNTVKIIKDSLPKGWTLKTDTSKFFDIILQTRYMELEPDMTSNDPPDPKGPCEIIIQVLKRISPDSIVIIRKRNALMKANLPHQNSKDNLENWYKENDKTLKIVNSEPTNYDNNYSYRITCQRLPKLESDKKTYYKLMTILNSIFLKYKD